MDGHVLGVSNGRSGEMEKGDLSEMAGSHYHAKSSPYERVYQEDIQSGGEKTQRVQQRQCLERGFQG